MGWIYAHYLIPLAPLAWVLAIAAVGNIAGQIGDLVESAYKRWGGVKDSGSSLPGHGVLARPHRFEFARDSGGVRGPSFSACPERTADRVVIVFVGRRHALPPIAMKSGAGFKRRFQSRDQRESVCAQWGRFPTCPPATFSRVSTFGFVSGARKDTSTRLSMRHAWRHAPHYSRSCQ